MTISLSNYINIFSDEKYINTLQNFGRGIEREALRVLPEGRLSTRAHPKALGSALTHDNITTDYSESLLEFITPVSYKAETAISQLEDIQKFTLSQISEELLWPISMPCFIDDESEVTIAQYGRSNIGKMKTVYRQGLKNRYGSMMQVISGIHFNFSFSTEFWQALQIIENNKSELIDYISTKYFALIRNYKRYCWLIPYLYGSSPVVCGSFLKGKKTKLPFKTTPKGNMYLAHATSLRMSDLGYTSSEQSSLDISYNSLNDYLSGVKRAINKPSEKFSKIGVKVAGEYQQLNTNVIQIENELYAPIRPKCVAKSGEKPSQALTNRGVEYIEVRALDVNPFSMTGISIAQVKFLEVFLTFCLFETSPTLDCQQLRQTEANMNDVVERGLDPTLMLNDNGTIKSIRQWGSEVFSQLKQVAVLLDKANGSSDYQEIVKTEFEKIIDSQCTPAAKILQKIVVEGESLQQLTLNDAVRYKQQLLDKPYQYFDQAYFEEARNTSFEKQTKIEADMTIDFDCFLTDYFQS